MMSTFIQIVGTIVTLSHADPSIVQTEYGPIQGLILPQENVRVFRSIPYAKPPIGDLRWSNPQPPSSWKETLDCTKEVVGCPQKCHQIPLDSDECPAVQSEDCLYLNVWTPLTATQTSLLPTLLFIHGGSFWTGFGGGLIYNGTKMVNVTGKIVVTINYRLGALGFLYDSSLGLDGNYGYFDQVAAIEWTVRNIRAFGGDPQRVTIFGESAGAHSVALHLLNTTSLISGGIMESPPVGLPLRTPTSWGTLPLTFSSELGCDANKLSNKERLECLLSQNASRIVEAQVSSNNADAQMGYALIKSGMPWTPTVDGKVFVDQPLVAFSNGAYNRNVPFMGGTNEGESFLFIAPVVTYEDLRRTLVEDFGEADSEKIIEFYNVSVNEWDDNLVEIAGNILTDFMFRCPTRNMMTSSVKHQSSESNVGFLYHFNYLASYVEHVWFYNPLCWTHVCHTEELPMVFDPNASSIDVYPTNEEVLTANQAQFYWTNFAETGDPSKGEHAKDLNTEWNEFGTSQSTLMMNDVGKHGVVMVDAPDEFVCDFWDSLGYNWFNGTSN